MVCGKRISYSPSWRPSQIFIFLCIVSSFLLFRILTKKYSQSSKSCNIVSYFKWICLNSPLLRSFQPQNNMLVRIHSFFVDLIYRCSLGGHWLVNGTHASFNFMVHQFNSVSRQHEGVRMMRSRQIWVHSTPSECTYYTWWHQTIRCQEHHLCWSRLIWEFNVVCKYKTEKLVDYMTLLQIK